MDHIQVPLQNKKKLELAPDSHKNAVDQLTDKNLKTILRYVYDKNPGWWDWKKRDYPDYAVEDEVKKVYEDISNNEADKGTQTTIASIGQALLNRRDTLKNIHELWESITLNYEGIEKIKKNRLHQFKDFDKLSPKEQQKDQVWIDAVNESIQSGGAKRKSRKSRKSKKSRKSHKSRKSRKSKKSRKSRKIRKSKGKK